MPIDSAPKDGSVILLWRFGPCAGYWSGDPEWAWETVNLYGFGKCMPNGFADGDTNLTHWMPLPEPPK
jgi:hypothetical protein